MADAVCPVCGYHGPAVVENKGSCLLEFVLWMLLLIPGIIYTFWRRTSLQPKCKRCGSTALVPDNTPEGQRLLKKFEAE